MSKMKLLMPSGIYFDIPATTDPAKFNKLEAVMGAVLEVEKKAQEITEAQKPKEIPKPDLQYKLTTHRNYRCKICGKTTKLFYAIVEHLEGHATNNKPQSKETE